MKRKIVAEYSLGITGISKTNIIQVLSKIERDLPAIMFGEMTPTKYYKAMNHSNRNSIKKFCINGITSKMFFGTLPIYVGYPHFHEKRFDRVMTAEEFLGESCITTSSTLYVPSTSFIPLDY